MGEVTGGFFINPSLAGKREKWIFKSQEMGNCCIEENRTCINLK